MGVGGWVVVWICVHVLHVYVYMYVCVKEGGGLIGCYDLP